MELKRNDFIQYNIKFIATVLVIMSQFLQVHAMVMPIVFENIHLLSWEDNYKFPVANPLVSDACKNFVICDSVKSYPRDLVAILMIELKLKNITSFSNDKFNNTENGKNYTEYKDLCETRKERIIFPLAAKDQRGKWQFILNKQGHRFQSFRIHECLDTPVQSCSKNVIVDDYHDLQCEQQFTKRAMVYLNLERKAVEIGYFRLPTCCSCYLEAS